MRFLILSCTLRQTRHRYTKQCLERHGSMILEIATDIMSLKIATYFSCVHSCWFLFMAWWIMEWHEEGALRNGLILGYLKRAVTQKVKTTLFSWFYKDRLISSVGVKIRSSSLQQSQENPWSQKLYCKMLGFMSSLTIIESTDKK